MKNLFLILVLVISTYSRSTVVSGTITDPQAQAWYGGTYDFQLEPPGLIYSGGVPLPTNSYHFRGVLDGSGAFSITVPDNTTLAPAGTYWRVTICSQTSSPVETTGGSRKDTCFYVDVTISGVSQSLSAVLSAAAPTPLVNGLLTPFAYSQAELQLVINGLMPGALYWDLGSSCLKVWNGSSWNCLGGGGGGGTVTSISGVSPIVATPNPITGVGSVSCPSCIVSIPTSITATAPIVVTPNPITGAGDISCPTCGVGTATVSSFSAGNLAPLFTSNVATPTTTPALTFTPSNAAANSILGNFTGASGSYSFNVISACGDSTHALKWTAGVGFGCQAITGSGGGGANRVSFDSCSPAQSVNQGNSYWRQDVLTYGSGGLANFDPGFWGFRNGVAGDVFCMWRVTSNITGNQTVILDISSDTTTTGQTDTFNICDATTSSRNVNGASFTCGSTQNFTTTATSGSNVELTFTISSTPVIDQYLLIDIHHASGTVTSEIRMWPPKIALGF